MALSDLSQTTFLQIVIRTIAVEHRFVSFHTTTPSTEHSALQTTRPICTLKSDHVLCVGDQGGMFGGLFLLNPIHHPGPWERTFSRARIRVLFIPRRISSPSTASLLAGLGRIPHDAVG